MDYLLAICQALGVALAIGALAAATGARSIGGAVLFLVAAMVGAVAAAISMSIDDQSIIGGVIVGAIGGWLAASVVSAVVSGASRRSDGSTGALGFIVAVGAAVLGALSILVPPVALVVLLALGWIALRRRRRGQRKYEGLRILR